jgi:hypothetical protein
MGIIERAASEVCGGIIEMGRGESKFGEQSEGKTEKPFLVRRSFENNRGGGI